MTNALLLTEVFPPQVGGSGRWLFEVYSRLPTDRIVVAAGEHPAAAVFDAEHGLTIVRWPFQLPSWGLFDWGALKPYWNLYRRLAKIVSGKQVSAVHCGRVLPEGWLARLLYMRRGLPYWVYVHGEELQYGLRSRQLAWMMRQVFASAAGVIANSHNTADLLATQWCIQREVVRVIHPGVNASRFVPAPRNQEVLGRLGWQGRRVVLTVGRLQVRKGHDMLIRALPMIRQLVPDVLYAIVGEGEERENLVSLAHDMGVTECVQFIGEACDERLLQCYQQCDLFVLPNREVDGDFEGFGMVLVEAQACGKTVIAGASGGTSETLRAGETGLVVDCREPEQLAREVAVLLLDESRRATMGSAARAWVVEHYDWPRLAQQVATVLGLETVAASPAMHRSAAAVGAAL